MFVFGSNGDVDVLLVKRETRVRELKIVEWLEQNYPVERER